MSVLFFDDFIVDSHLAFEQDCVACCVAKGEEAVAAHDYEGDIALCSAAIGLDSSGDSSLFALRRREKFSGTLYAEAIIDAEKVRMIAIIFPSNYSDCNDS